MIRRWKYGSEGLHAERGRRDGAPSHERFCSFNHVTLLLKLLKLVRASAKIDPALPQLPLNHALRCPPPPPQQSGRVRA